MKHLNFSQDDPEDEKPSVPEIPNFPDSEPSPETGAKPIRTGL